MQSAACTWRGSRIYRIEKDFWENVASRYVSRAEPVVCLDFGTGAGAVPLTLGQYLKKEDTFICSDISGGMLEQCEHNIRQEPFACEFSFIKIEGTRIPLRDHSVDVITLNSVLHHIFDLKAFSSEAARILKPGGIVIATHEPNKTASLPFCGKVVRSVARIILRPRLLFLKLAQISPFMERTMRFALGRVSSRYRLRNKMLSDLAEQLKNEELIDFNLRGTEIQQIVDFHSEGGFVKQEIISDIFGRFEIVYWETYDYLGFWGQNRLYRAVSEFMRSRWPDGGGNVRFILSRQQA